MTVYPLGAWQIQRRCSTSSVATAVLMFCWRCVGSPITLKVQCVIVYVQNSFSLSYACTHAASNPQIKFVPTSNRLSVLSCYSCTIHFTSIVPMCTTSVQCACSQLGYHIKTADTLSSFCQHHRTTSCKASVCIMLSLYIWLRLFWLGSQRNRECFAKFTSSLVCLRWVPRVLD